jgi:hypothetical protein
MTSIGGWRDRVADADIHSERLTGPVDGAGHADSHRRIDVVLTYQFGVERCGFEDDPVLHADRRYIGDDPRDGV